MAFLLDAALLSGCGGAGDPLGGPYGGEGTIIGPTEGGALETGDDGGDAETTSSEAAAPSGSSGSSSGAGTSTGEGASSGNTPSTSSGDAGLAVGGGGTGDSDDAGPAVGGGGTGNSDDGGPAVGGGGTGNSGGGAPTWTEIFTKYLASGTVGDCSHCHGGTSTAPACFSWLKGQGYVGTSTPSLTSSSTSCLTWYGGNMPKGGGSNAQAVADMNAWAAAGALDN